ncbi:MAG: hypothetical protein IJR34_03440 [Bacteroidales bacterium]|nr:hypothetical protein [Bacteroidales bacterium]
MKTRLMILACIAMMLPSCGSFTQLSSDDYAYSDGIYAGGAGYRKAESEPVTLKYFPTFPESLHLDGYTLIAREDLGNVTNYYFVDRWASPLWYDWYSPFRPYRWYDPWYRPFAWSRPVYGWGPWYWNDPWYWGYGPWRYDPWYWGNSWYCGWGYPGRYMPWGRPHYGPREPYYGRAFIPVRPVYPTNGPRHQGGIGSGTGSGGYRSSPRTGSGSGYSTVPRGSSSERSSGSNGSSSWSRSPGSPSGGSTWSRSSGSSSWGGSSSGAPRSSGGSSFGGGGWSRGGGSGSSYNGHSGAVRR